MLGQLVKWAAFAAVWTKVKPVFWGTLATALFILAVNAVHAEFVDFLRIDQELSGTSGPLVSDVRVWLLFSYLGKLSLILVSTAAWLFYLQRKGWFSAGKQDRVPNKVAFKAPASGAVTAQVTIPSQPPARFSEEFEFLRADRPLRSKGQVILDAKRSG